jgi:hypothetical protein|nr:MAG TPA: hypothetical protein [Caudoviricetes sp.]
MNVLFMPCWDENVGGEAYNVILENDDFKKTKISMGFDFNEYLYYVVSVEDGVLSLRRECVDDDLNRDYENLVLDGVVSKVYLDEVITVLKKFGDQLRYIKQKEESKKREEIWLNSSVYEVEIKGWEW